MDAIQIVLLFVIIILTTLLVVLGVQVFFILRDLRKTITKANKVLEEAESIAGNVSGPIATLSTLATGLKAGSILTAAKFAKKLLRDRDEEKHERK